MNERQPEPTLRPRVLALLAGGLVLLLFLTWLGIEHALGPSLSAEGRSWLHLARGVSSTVLVAAALIYGVYWSQKRVRQMESRLRHQEEHLAQVLKDSVDAIVGIDSKGTVVYWNRGAEILYGYRPDEMIGQSFQKLLPDTSPGLISNVSPEPIGRGGRLKEFLAERLTKSGEKISVLVTRAEAGGELRECVGCRAIEQNLSELRELERQLSRSEKLAMVGEMAAGLAHEIKNPLAGIAGAIQVLGDTLPLGDERKPVVGKVLEQVKRIDRTVRDLLVYARPKAAQLKPTDLRRMIDGTLGVISLIPGARVEVVRRYQDGLPPAMVDEELFGQVLSNLFINAVQAMPLGGTLSVSTSVDSAGVHISVRDTGFGIPEANLKRIFDPFYTTKTRGTGLGLSICQRVIEAHQGSISVKSQVGEGTEFVVTLPRRPASQKTVLPAKSAGNPI